MISVLNCCQLGGLAFFELCLMCSEKGAGLRLRTLFGRSRCPATIACQALHTAPRAAEHGRCSCGGRGSCGRFHGGGGAVASELFEAAWMKGMSVSDLGYL